MSSAAIFVWRFKGQVTLLSLPDANAEINDITFHVPPLSWMTPTTENTNVIRMPISPRDSKARTVSRFQPKKNKISSGVEHSTFSI